MLTRLNLNDKLVAWNFTTTYLSFGIDGDDVVTSLINFYLRSYLDLLQSKHSISVMVANIASTKGGWNLCLGWYCLISPSQNYSSY